MSRARRFALLVLASLVLLAGALVWALPEILRRIAVDRISRQTRRAVTIEDIDLNLFTGRLADQGLSAGRAATAGSRSWRPSASTSGSGSGTSCARTSASGRSRWWPPRCAIIRQGSGDFNFSDLLGGAKEPAEPPPTPSRWTVSVERARLVRGRAARRGPGGHAAGRVAGRGTSISTRGSLTTRTGDMPGRAGRQRADQRGAPRPPRRAGAARSRSDCGPPVARRVRDASPDAYIYIAARHPLLPAGAAAGLVLTVGRGQRRRGGPQGHGLGHARAGALRRCSRRAVRIPSLSASRLKIEIQEADLIARRLTVAGVDLEGLDLAARRDARGVIDLVDLFTPKPTRPPAPSKPPAPAPLPCAGADPAGGPSSR